MRGTLVLPLALLAALGCKNKGSEPVVAAPTQTGAMAAPAAPAGAQGVTGTVLERIDASPYCYLRLQTAQGEVWAAVPEAKVEKGTEVTILSPMVMTNFESKTLKRTFAQILFGNLGAPGGAPAQAGAVPPSTAPSPMAAAPAPVEVGKIDKATGPDARTIAEVWAQKGALKEKPVTVRGKVVKYNEGVMGRNWMHIQDGSGDAAKGTHDLTITSLDRVAKGDVVTAKGIVRTSKDFGAGYTYEVIVEEAKVVKK